MWQPGPHRGASECRRASHSQQTRNDSSLQDGTSAERSCRMPACDSKSLSPLQPYSSLKQTSEHGCSQNRKKHCKKKLKTKFYQQRVHTSSRPFTPPKRAVRYDRERLAHTHPQTVPRQEQVVGVEDSLVMPSDMGAHSFARSKTHLGGNFGPFSILANNCKSTFFCN